MGIITNYRNPLRGKIRDYETYFDKNLKDSFDPRKIVTDLTCMDSINKPAKAWWGSPVGAKFGWKEWCEAEEFGIERYDFDSEPIRWGLKDGSSIFVIDTEDIADIDNPNNLIVHYTSREDGNHLDFQRILDDGIIAIELANSSIGHMFMNKYELMFNCWDCESIVVLDPQSIVWY